ncbi:MAG TPA: hypothetical protein VJU82_17515 [Acidobacteriaceae bacterium]|nr:hypothetical protein [Acidobacteriaceae bacterium]
MSEREFLVVYDYGTGGVWGFARAASETEILETFPELTVVYETPAWMTQEEERNIRSVSSFAIGEPSSYPEWLRVLVAERRAS